MSIRKAIALASLAFALAVLSPASALAGADGSDRPVRATFAGTLSLNTTTGILTADAGGVSSHLGRYTVRLVGRGAPSGAGFRAAGTLVQTAANGDQLLGTFVASSDALPHLSHTTTMVATVTGGTGRFESAEGIVESTVHVTFGSFDPETQTLLNTFEGTNLGLLSY